MYAIRSYYEQMAKDSVPLQPLPEWRQSGGAGIGDDHLTEGLRLITAGLQGHHAAERQSENGNSPGRWQVV